MTKEQIEPILRFRIYYGDGSTYSGDPYYAPPTNVQCIVMEDPKTARGYRLVTERTRDAYYFREGRWWACDEMGFYDYMYEHIGPKAVVFGRTMTRSEDYWAIVNRAKDEGLDV